jgi:hypothetical protein
MLQSIIRPADQILLFLPVGAGCSACNGSLPTSWSFSSLVLAAAEGDGGLALVPPPASNVTTNSGAAAAWLASGDWLLPQAFINLWSSYANTSAASAIRLALSNINMVVAPQSLAVIQQALSLVGAAAVNVTQVRSATTQVLGADQAVLTSRQSAEHPDSLPMHNTRVSGSSHCHNATNFSHHNLHRTRFNITGCKRDHAHSVHPTWHQGVSRQGDSGGGNERQCRGRHQAE